VALGHFVERADVTWVDPHYAPAVRLIGLTGGIGSGKSTVSAALSRRGAVVVDADAIVRQLQEPGGVVFEEMVERFGEGILDDAGALDRAAVARIVFHDKEALAALNAIVHPRVYEEIDRRVADQRGTDHVVVLDIPLLGTPGWPGLQGRIVVDVDPEVAIERLVADRGFDEEDARARIANQISREDRLATADYVVDNGGSLRELEAEVDLAWEWIQTVPDE
jgi:dephospho-CoA kinase